MIVDADGAYQASPHAKALEPMATIWIDGFLPDLVCSATVFQFKQILWHAGILASKAEVGAGGGANRYRPEEDRWSLDEHILRTPVAGVRRDAMCLGEPLRGT